MVRVTEKINVDLTFITILTKNRGLRQTRYTNIEYLTCI